MDRLDQALSVISVQLQKHPYSNILKILQPKWFSDIFLISSQNIDCGYSLEPPRQKNVYSYKPQFYNIKVGFKGVKII